MSDSSEKKMSFRIDAGTADALARIEATVDDGVLPGRRRSAAIRHAINFTAARLHSGAAPVLPLEPGRKRP